MRSEETVIEWWLQRLTGAFVAVYVLALLVLLLLFGPPSAEQWHGLFAQPVFRVITLIALVSAFYHGLIGVLHVWPDYIKDPALRAVLVGASWFAFGAYSVWAVLIVFGLNR
ncbi:MAG: succinate dehydrogenase, hydrophobic membrane anchor protein [Casimicrobiaceae bacterium]|nr:succinate dehydrogenase, hydrophobic membrane anchor protein [Casimicrobiaceae bacterium]MCX8099264.1 succinate dehydrogenase, hydrophobic membrane anchor protein [Casimicrobiaceae bacterium]MDW8312807.1 succinate dehydrogenase, hydrophobic membrane anchor protein [Burkholderiales bacterium]